MTKSNQRREFWINFYDDGEVYQCCELEFDLDKDFKNTIKLREVSPELDLAISGLVEALETAVKDMDFFNGTPVKPLKKALASYKAAVEAKGDK